jgi:DeoR/GlpR family transcriptional regulator of sugar metabolism
VQQTKFVETETILKALEFASTKGGFSDPRQKKVAASLIKTMKSTRSVSGRHQQLRSFLKKGATVSEMMRATSSSRRTVFRYLNHFEEAGMTVTLQGGKYKLQ